MRDIINKQPSLLLNKYIYLISYNFDDKFLLKQLYPNKFLNLSTFFHEKESIFPLKAYGIEYSREIIPKTP
jgi:hypothetical protein